MTRRDIVERIAESYGDGVAMAMRGTMVSDKILSGLISETYVKAFENGIVYNQWDTFPNDFYTIQADADAYKKYAEEKIL